MKICPNCNGENREEALFCTNCGNKFEEQSLNPDINAIEKDSTSIITGTTEPNVSPNIQPSSQPSGSFTPPVDSSPKKKSKALAYFLAFFTVIAVIIFAISVISNANPTYKLLKGVSKFSKMGKATVTTTIDVDYDGDDDVADIINEISIKLETAADINNLLAQISLDLLYANKSVVQAAAGVNNKDLYIDLKDLHKKKFYQDIEEIVPEYKDYVNDYKIIKKVYDGISLKLDRKEYFKIIKDSLDDDIKGSGNKVTLTLNPNTLSKLARKLLREAKKDTKLTESIRKNGIDFIEKVIKEEKKLKIVDVDEFEYALELFEDKDDFEDYYREAITDMLDDMDYMYFDFDDIPEIDLTFRFGFGNTIKGIDFTVEIENRYDTIKIAAKTDIKKGASIKTNIDKKNAIEIEELYGEELKDVAEEVTENLIKSIKKNKDLTNKIEDLSGEDIDDSIEMLTYDLFRYAPF